MPDNIYEVVSQAARYWFLFLMALIVWRSFRWLRRDRRQRKKRLKRLPDAGYVGELVVLKGNDELPEGLALPVSNEGILGCLRGDDIYVPVSGVGKKHLWYSFDEEDGLRVEPYSRRIVEVDGETFTGRRRRAYLTHGSLLTVGEAQLRLRMFAGFEYAGVRYAPEAEEEGAEAETAEPENAAPAAVQPAAPPAGGVTFTPEQMAVIQQMQWAAALQAMQAVQTRRPYTAPGVESDSPPMEYDDAETPPDGEEETPDEQEDIPQEEPARASKRLRRSPLPPLPPIPAAGRPGAQRRADARGYAEDEYARETSPLFYPPVQDEEPRPEEDTPYEYADEDEAPRSLYVEPDEAAEAKRLVWDKYLKGGRHL